MRPRHFPFEVTAAVCSKIPNVQLSSMRFTTCGERSEERVLSLAWGGLEWFLTYEHAVPQRYRTAALDHVRHRFQGREQHNEVWDAGHQQHNLRAAKRRICSWY